MLSQSHFLFSPGSVGQRFWALLPIWLLTLPLLFGSYCNAEQPTIKMITVGKALNPSPPIIWYDKCQKIQKGSIPYLLGRMMTQLGYRLEWMEAPGLNDYPNWQVLFTQNLEEEVINLAVVLSTENSPVLLKTKHPFFNYQWVVVSRKDQPMPRKLSDLQGRQGVVFFYSKAKIEKTIQQIKQTLKKQRINYTIASSPTEAFLKVKNGQADFTLANPYLARAIAQKEGMSNDIYISDISITSQSFHLATSTSGANTDLIGKLDALFEDYRDQKVFERAYQVNMRKWVNYGTCEGQD